MRVPGGLLAMLAAAVLGAAVAVAVLVAAGVVGESRTVERTVGVPQAADDGEARAAALSAVAPAVLRVLPGDGVRGGSAVVVAADGTAVTAAAVVGEARRVRVAWHGVVAPARVLATLPALGVAVLAAPSGTGEPAALGGLESPVPPGLPVMAVSNATGLDPEVSVGVVSGVRRETSTPPELPPEDVLLTDAAASTHALGGALADERGRVLGVVIRAGASGAALPGDRAAAVARAVVDGDPVQVAYLGVVAVDVAEAPPAGAEEGALVVAVRPGSPAEAAGLRPGDAVLGASGRTVRDAGELADVVQDADPGDALTLAVVRDGARAQVDVRLVARPAP